MKLSRFATLVLAVTAAACSTLEVNTDYAPGTDFSKYQTFTIKHGAASRNAIAVIARAIVARRVIFITILL